MTHDTQNTNTHHGRVVAGREQKLLVGRRLDARAAGGEVKVLQQLEAAAVRVVLAQRRALALGQPLRLGLAAGDVVDLKLKLVFVFV